MNLQEFVKPPCISLPFLSTASHPHLWDFSLFRQPSWWFSCQILLSSCLNWNRCLSNVPACVSPPTSMTQVATDSPQTQLLLHDSGTWEHSYSLQTLALLIRIAFHNLNQISVSKCISTLIQTYHSVIECRPPGLRKGSLLQDRGRQWVTVWLIPSELQCSTPSRMWGRLK